MSNESTIWGEKVTKSECFSLGWSIFGMRLWTKSLFLGNVLEMVADDWTIDCWTSVLWASHLEGKTSDSKGIQIVELSFSVICSLSFKKNAIWKYMHCVF